jgi:hypothetical protein
MDFVRTLSEPAKVPLIIALSVVILCFVAIQINDIGRLNNLIIFFTILFSAVVIGILFFDRLDREEESKRRKDSLKFKKRISRKNEPR